MKIGKHDRRPTRPLGCIWFLVRVKPREQVVRTRRQLLWAGRGRSYRQVPEYLHRIGVYDLAAQ
jgi:hypothetical protein